MKRPCDCPHCTRPKVLAGQVTSPWVKRAQSSTLPAKVYR